MSVDLLKETFISIQEVPSRIPPRTVFTKSPDGSRRAKTVRLSVNTAHRWAKIGVSGIKLEIVQVGRLTYTSVEAMDRFFSKLTSMSEKSPLVKTDARRRVSGA